jgi:hypothetical protein
MLQFQRLRGQWAKELATHPQPFPQPSPMRQPLLGLLGYPIQPETISLGHLTHSSGEHESTSFEDVLAIILAGLSSLGWISGI